MQHPIRDQDQP